MKENLCRSQSERQELNLPILRHSTKQVAVANGSVEQGKPPHPTSFTRASVNVHKTEDVLIRLEGKPVLIGVRDQYGRYKVPLVRRKGKSLPRVPTSSEVTHLEQAQNVYDLPSVEEAIRWLHACCGFPAKRTWLTTIKKGNYTGWPLLTAKRVNKYSPDAPEIAKGHLNQTRRNVKSTKVAITKTPQS